MVGKTAGKTGSKIRTLKRSTRASTTVLIWSAQSHPEKKSRTSCFLRSIRQDRRRHSSIRGIDIGAAQGQRAFVAQSARSRFSFFTTTQDNSPKTCLCAMSAAFGKTVGSMPEDQVMERRKGSKHESSKVHSLSAIQEDEPQSASDAVIEMGDVANGSHATAPHAPASGG